MAGNSLGLMPITARSLLNHELDTWAEMYAFTSLDQRTVSCSSQLINTHNFDVLKPVDTSPASRTIRFAPSLLSCPAN